MTERELPEDERLRRDQAIAWHVKFADSSAREADWLAFTQWLEADPANRLAYDRVEALDVELTSADLGGAVTPLRAPQVVIAHRAKRAMWFAGAGALIAASLAVVLVLRNAEPEAPTPVTYVTRIGETKTVALADGSRIDINTASSVTIQVDKTMRRVVLSRGEGLFHVAKDARHPFVVELGDRSVRVVGTTFDILRTSSQISVVVAEGRVAVSSRTPGVAEAMLGPGDRLTYSEDGKTATIQRVDPNEAMSWRQGYLVYRDAPLSKVIDDLNRYFPTPVVLQGGPGTQRFTGVLRLDNQDAVLRRLAEFLSLEASHRPDGRIGLRPVRPGP